MATLILTAVGTAVGGPIGGAVGAILGQAADSALFAPKPRQGPRLGELAVQTSSYGTAIPKIFGTMRVAGTVIWSTDLIERRGTTGGGKGRASTINYGYSASFAVALSARPVVEVRRIWADGKLLRGAAGDFKARTQFRLYSGDEDQAPDPLIAAAEGGGTPAFRGIAYAMFEELELADYGNRIPSLTFEIVADPAAVDGAVLAAELGRGALTPSASPSVLGFAATGDSIRGAIEDLSELLPLTFADDGDTLLVGSPTALGEPLPQRHEAQRRELVRRAASSVAGEVSLTYYDASRDYQTSLQRAVRPEADTTAVERLGLPAVLDAVAARAMAERRLDAVLAGREKATVTCNWACAGLKPGTLVELEGESGRWRVERWTLGRQEVKLELRRSPAQTEASGGGASGRAQAQPDLPHGPSSLSLIDVPLPSASGGPGIFAMAAGTSPGWRRAELSASFDDGASWTDIGRTAAPGILGTAVSALPAFGSTLLDLANSLDITLLHDDMTLLYASDDGLVGGANLALVGDELVQFGVADRIGVATWRLSRLLRGRRGTEWAAPLHAAGEPFAMIGNDSCLPVPLPPGVSEGAFLRLLAEGPGDETAVEADLSLCLESAKPPSPAHLRIKPLSGGDTLISWVRRSRLGWAWSSGGDAPLGEEAERYRLVFTGAIGERTLETAEPSYLYAAEERAADGDGDVLVQVMQLGSSALSRPAAITIS
jgi:Putative phage tail protein